MSEQLNLFDELAFFEGADVEYKAAKGGLPGDLWETYSAFANTEGGTIWLGVSQRGGQLDIHGVPNAPSLRETRQPDRVVLDLPMLFTLPEGALDELRRRFGGRFDTLSPDEVQAVVTAHLEGDVTNQRLQEMLTLHRVDITRMLRGARA